MSVNMDHMQNASRLTTKGIAAVEEFEAGSVVGRTGVVYELTPAQITQLKQDFAAMKNEAIAAWNAVTAS